MRQCHCLRCDPDLNLDDNGAPMRPIGLAGGPTDQWEQSEHARVAARLGTPLLSDAELAEQPLRDLLRAAKAKLDPIKDRGLALKIAAYLRGDR